MSEEITVTIKDKLYEGWWATDGKPFVFWTADEKILFSSWEEDWFKLECGKSYKLMVSPTNKPRAGLMIDEIW